MGHNVDNIAINEEAGIFPLKEDKSQQIDSAIAKLSEAADQADIEALETANKPQKTIDYVTYSINAEELKDLSEFEMTEFASKNRETLYTAIHRLIAKHCRVFELGAIIASNGAMDPNEPLTIVYRRPLKTDERLGDFEPDQIVDGKVVETLHLALGSSLATRLFYAAAIFAPLYNALRSQYGIHHIYNMAGRLASTVVVGDPSTYYVIDQTIGNGVRKDDAEEFVAFRMIYTGIGQTSDVLTRIPAIVGYRVYETDVSSNIAEVFPVVLCGRRIGFNTYLSFDCVFEEPKVRVGRTEDELEVEDLSVGEMVTLVYKEQAMQHVNRKTGTVIE